HWHDTWMIELRRDLRLFEEAGEADTCCGVRGRNTLARTSAGVSHPMSEAGPLRRNGHHLHRQRAAEVAVAHAEDNAHATTRDFVLEPVAAGLAGRPGLGRFASHPT